MSAQSSIEWTDATWNPVTGCDRVSPGCDHCYAETLAHRFGRPFIGAVQCHPERLDLPLRWRKPRRVFVNSVSDLFHPDVPDDFIAQAFAVMSIAEAHTFQVLTKRPQRMAKLLASETFRLAWFTFRNDRAVEPDVQRMATRGATSLAMRWPLPNVWLGVSVESQRYADLRIPHLLATPAAVRFLSIEPLLEPVHLSDAWLYPNHASIAGETTVRSEDRIDWVIVGGESGPGARPMHPQWAADIRDECVAARVPFFFKQWGAWRELAHDEVYGERRDTAIGRTAPAAILGNGGTALMRRVGKKDAGRELDGRTWDEYPAATVAPR